MTGILERLRDAILGKCIREETDRALGAAREARTATREQSAAVDGLLKEMLERQVGKRND